MQTITTEAEEKRYAELQRMALDFARKGETDCLAPMLDAGMPVNLSDEKGNSLLMLSSYNEHFESSKMLLEHGAEADRRNDHGQTPLGGCAFNLEKAPGISFRVFPYRQLRFFTKQLVDERSQPA